MKTSIVPDIQNKLEKLKLEASEASKVEQVSLEEQERLMPLEQAARQKVVELSSIMESEKNQGSVLKAILQSKETNLIPGKYNIAISTACHGFDYIVVENTAAAQACVELLRTQKLGVATFMILEKQANHLPRLKEKIVTPEGVPHLFDLINVQDERMKLAFFAALGNTILAKDIDQATHIAYGGKKGFWRVVTLDGALFEKFGTMTGGGSRPRGGKIRSSIRASVSGEAVANAEKELSVLVESLSIVCNKLNAEKELSVLVESLSIVCNKLNDAVKRCRDSEKAISPLEMELAKSQKEIDSLKLLFAGAP